MHTDERQPGPDFLDSFADASLSSGLDVNAAEFRARAKEWRNDQQRIDALEAKVAGLERQLRTATERERALDDIKTHLRAANESLACATAATAA